MVLREAQQQLHGWDVKLLATDLDSACSPPARAGVYGRDGSQAMAGERVSRFFDKGSGAQAGKFARAGRAAQSRSPSSSSISCTTGRCAGPFDAIFCRNVIIYFDKDTQRALFERMAALQRPGDFLFLGHSESLYRVSDQYELIGRTIYRAR